MSRLEHDFFADDRLLEDPHGYYAGLRDVAAVWEAPASQCWLVFRYEEVVEVHRSEAFGVSIEAASTEVLAKQRTRRHGRGRSSLLRLDPPEHTRMRRMVQDAMACVAAERSIDALATEVQSVLRRWHDVGCGEVVDDFAAPIIAASLCRVFGLRVELGSDLQRLVPPINRIVDTVHTGDDADRGEAAAVALRQLFATAIATRDFGSGIVAELDAARARGELDTDDVLDQIVLLTVNGLGTAVWLVSNALSALATHPDQWTQLRSEPALIENAIDETLRFDSPTQFGRRIARRAETVGGVHIPQGGVVITALGSANRDPVRWGATFDAFDVRRPDARHNLAFGSGIHYCLGARLARHYAIALVGATIERFERAEITAETARLRNRFFRGFARLGVRFRSDAPRAS